MQDTAYSIIGVPGGFIVAGTTTSNDGDVSGNHGSQDGWVFKIDSVGNLLWQKTFGGVDRDVLNNVIWDAASNSLLFSGYSASANIGSTSGHGNHDFWVMKTSMNGDLIWAKLLGGTGEDAGFGLSKVPGISQYLVSGLTKSIDGDVTGSGKEYDGWALMLDEPGNLIWQKKVASKTDENLLFVFPEGARQFLCMGSTQKLLLPDSYCSGCSDKLVAGFLVAKLSVGNSLSGHTFFDTNNNGVKDPGEADYDQLSIQAQKQYGSSKASFPYDGHYEMAIDTGVYTIKAVPYN